MVRLSVVADLVRATVFVFLALILYRLLRHVDRTAAGAMVVLVAIAATITCLTAIFELEAGPVASGAVNLADFRAAGAQTLVLLLVAAHHYGLLTAQIFFGLGLTPAAYLADKPGWFPKALRVVLVLGCVSYLVDVLVAFLVPDGAKEIHASCCPQSRRSGWSATCS